MALDSEASPRRLKSVCAAMLAVELLYCLATTATGIAPAWSMFSRIERFDYTLSDRDGRAVDLREHLPPVFYLTDRGMLRYAARCLCAKESQRAPFTLDFGASPEPVCGR